MKSAGEISMIQKEAKAEEKAEADEQIAASLPANITRVQVDLLNETVMDEEAKEIALWDPNCGFILGVESSEDQPNGDLSLASKWEQRRNMLKNFAKMCIFTTAL